MTSKIIEELNKCETQKTYENIRYTLIDDELRDYIEESLERLEYIDKQIEKVIPVLPKFQQLVELENEVGDLFVYIFKLKKVVDWIKHTFEITLDSKVRISDGIDCIQAFPIDLKTNEVIYELLKEVLGE